MKNRFHYACQIVIGHGGELVSQVRFLIHKLAAIRQLADEEIDDLVEGQFHAASDELCELLDLNKEEVFEQAVEIEEAVKRAQEEVRRQRRQEGEDDVGGV